MKTLGLIFCKGAVVVEKGMRSAQGLADILDAKRGIYLSKLINLNFAFIIRHPTPRVDKTNAQQLAGLGRARDKECNAPTSWAPLSVRIREGTAGRR
ncbi:hypothetical protein FRAAL6328 [Frankia alni ACN14a]|uniref:Uncharacterized protein n=1 Tax=Frankia alni (strain DSM 45986 / CECT 9034 / ACN14a) TaxID=326424 RepID=Q0RC76_FRAAA|nr:hypothetical protein FRAAL6328 [Frankia alni ACN14a]